MLSAQEGKTIILSSVREVGDEACELLEAHGRVLASDVIALQDIPPFDNSSMDGYAVRTEDLTSKDRGNQVQLKLQGHVEAGRVLTSEMESGTTIRILTGAPVPKSANAIIEQEAVSLKNGFILVPGTIERGRNIRKRGEDIKTGEVVFKKGSRIRSAHLGVLASLGLKNCNVYRRPRVGYVTTGNELIEMGEELSPGKIRNSNSYTLWGLITESGCQPVNLGIARDEERELEEKLRKGLSCDVLITSGGVSVGDYDLVLNILKKLGVNVLFWKLNIKPGMPIAFGMYERMDSVRAVSVFALPGNPVSTAVTFREFVLPGLSKIAGNQNEEPNVLLKATLEQDFMKRDGKRHYVRGTVRMDQGVLRVRTTGSQSSGVLTSLVKANCLIHIPEETSQLNAGDEVEIELLSPPL